MIFHENPLLADDSHEKSYLFFSKIEKDVTKFVVCCSCLGKMSQNLLSYSVLISALKDKNC